MTNDSNMPLKISEEEHQQLLQTVEMFEAITESQPDDYQSLEILKEAYVKLGQPQDSIRTSKKLAATYVRLGHISQAILEYEGILQECPTDTAVQTALTELAAKTTKLSAGPDMAPPSAGNSKPATPVGVPAGAPPSFMAPGKVEDGNRALANILIGEKLATPQAIEPLLQKLKSTSPNPADKNGPTTLIQLLANEQIAKLDDLITAMVEKSGLPFLPLNTYDVDRDVACLLPKEIAWEFLIVPFDLISRSVLVATCNPFDRRARDQAQAMLDYNIFWYVTTPADIVAALRHVHGVEAIKPGQVKS